VAEISGGRSTQATSQLHRDRQKAPKTIHAQNVPFGYEHCGASSWVMAKMPEDDQGG
jgi:hypothetical protein